MLNNELAYLGYKDSILCQQFQIINQKIALLTKLIDHKGHIKYANNIFFS